MEKTEIKDFLSKYNYVESGNKFTIKTTEDRVDLLKKIAKDIKGAIYSKTGSSSVGQVKIDRFTILAKPARESSAGSGAGSDVTSLVESAQCYYCAAAWYGKDFSETELRKSAKYVNATINVDEVIKKLPDSWIISCSKTAESLKKKFGSKQYTFHRGSNFTESIANNFNKINKPQKLFSNINKWSPADIYMVSNEGNRVSFNFDDINNLNKQMLDSFKNKSIIGVSLKKTTSASIEILNTGEKHAYKYLSATLGKKDYFSSKDVYLMYDDGEIQFRGTPLVWQGEIMGKTAKHGKISGGPTKKIIDQNSTIKLDSQSDVQGAIQSKNSNFMKKFYTYYTQLTKDSITFETFKKKVYSKEYNWQVSKYMGTQLVYIMNKLSKPSQQIILNSIINYAKSQSDLSAPFVKVS